VFRVPFIALFCTVAIASFEARSNEPSVKFYELSGRNANAIREQINEKRPRDANGESFDAVTRSRIGYTFRYAPTPGGCKFTEFTSTLETEITMPRWLDLDPTSRLGQKWQRYHEALYHHELGHRDISARSMSELEAIGKNFESSGNCDVIAEEFKLSYGSILQKSRLEQARYDKETDHGKNFGATFP